MLLCLALGVEATSLTVVLLRTGPKAQSGSSSPLRNSQTHCPSFRVIAPKGRRRGKRVVPPLKLANGQNWLMRMCRVDVISRVKALLSGNTAGGKKGF